MAEVNPNPQQQQAGPGQVMVHVDETHAHTTYANAWQMNAGQDEIICDLGVQVPRMMGNQQAISFQVGARIVFSPNSAMRFAAALQQVIAQREQRLAEASKR
ncbi:MAG: DUF3467 domain-containing protein [Phycisphaerales bacterium]|nr:DUF3467 domain-containing protein [Phycisphaerales bacterium]